MGWLVLVLILCWNNFVWLSFLGDKVKILWYFVIIVCNWFCWVLVKVVLERFSGIVWVEDEDVDVDGGLFGVVIIYMEFLNSNRFVSGI